MDPTAQQASLNRASAGAWEAFATHRARVTGLLEAGAAQGGLCVLGAGNCNDLDLPRLLNHHGRAVLADLDLEAMAAGVARQGLSGDPRIQLHAADLSGSAGAFSRWSAGGAVGEGELLGLVEAPKLGTGLDGAFGTVVSACLLSQLVDATASALGEDHPRFPDGLACVRLGHLRLLTRLTRPGGLSLLVTDLVSSATCPEIETAPPSALPQVLMGAIARRNFFSGLNPAVLMKLLSEDAELSARVARAELSEPWIWDLGPRRYAVYAIGMRRTERA